MKSLAHPPSLGALEERLLALQPNTPRLWGRMSAHAMVCHLLDSFEGVLNRRPIKEASLPIVRTIMKYGALYAPTPWPKGVATRPEVDQERGGTRPVDFEAQRNALLRAMADFGREGAPAGVRHPIFGSMTQPQWQRWAWMHVDHHLRQFGL